jgi:hypothetical protein
MLHATLHPLDAAAAYNNHPVGVLLHAYGVEEDLVHRWLWSDACEAGRLPPPWRQLLIGRADMPDAALRALLAANRHRRIRVAAGGGPAASDEATTAASMVDAMLRASRVR